MTLCVVTIQEVSTLDVMSAKRRAQKQWVISQWLCPSVICRLKFMEAVQHSLREKAGLFTVYLENMRLKITKC